MLAAGLGRPNHKEMERRGIPDGVDPRSYEEQGVAKQPKKEYMKPVEYKRWERTEAAKNKGNRAVTQPVKPQPERHDIASQIASVKQRFNELEGERQGVKRSDKKPAHSYADGKEYVKRVKEEAEQKREKEQADKEKRQREIERDR